MSHVSLQPFRPIHVQQNDTIYDGSNRDLRDQFCRFSQYGEGGNEVKVEGFYSAAHRMVRINRQITFKFPGDEEDSFLNTSQGKVDIEPLGKAELVEEQEVDGKLQVGDFIAIGSFDKPISTDVINGRLAELEVGHAYRIKAGTTQGIKIYSGKLSQLAPASISLTLNSNCSNTLYFDGVKWFDIRRIGTVTTDN